MFPARLLCCLLTLCALAAPASAQGPIALGVPQQGDLSGQFDQDVWTLGGVAPGDSIVIAAKNLTQSGFVPAFLLAGPLSVDQQSFTTSTGSVTRLRATENGTYTLTAQPGQASTFTGSYQLVVLKVPGANTVPVGDEGGALAPGGVVSGQVPVGDLDPWTFTACAGATPRVLLSEATPNPSNQFNPALKLYGPDGALVEETADTTVVDVTTAPLPLTGTYTLIVHGALGANPLSGDYTLQVAGACASLPVPVGNSETYSMNVNTSITVPAPGVLANDTSPGGSALTATLSVPPQHGTLTLAANGGFTYTPVNGYTGTDTFSYFPVNANGVGSLTFVYLQVNAVSAVQPASGLFAKLIVANTVTLQWTPPTSGPAPTGYILDGGLTPGGTIASIPIGTSPVFTIAVPTGSFYLRLRTVAGAQISGPSNEILVHVNVPVPPSSPAGLLGTAGGNALALAWRNTYGGGAPTALVLDVTGSLSASLPLALSDHFTFPSVPPGQYTFRVRATNAAGASGPSNAVTLSFPQACSGAPQPPANLVAYAQGSTLFVSWDPASTGGAPTAFTLDVTGAISATVPVGGLRAVSGGVGPGSYTLRVSGQNACGASALSAPVTVVVP